MAYSCIGIWSLGDFDPSSLRLNIEVDLLSSNYALPMYRVGGGG